MALMPMLCSSFLLAWIFKLLQSRTHISLGLSWATTDFTNSQVTQHTPIDSWVWSGEHTIFTNDLDETSVDRVGRGIAKMVCKVTFRPKILQPLGFLPISRIQVPSLPLHILFFASQGAGETLSAIRRCLPHCAVLHGNAEGQPNHEKTSDTLSLRISYPNWTSTPQKCQRH